MFTLGDISRPENRSLENVSAYGSLRRIAPIFRSYLHTRHRVVQEDGRCGVQLFICSVKEFRDYDDQLKTDQVLLAKAVLTPSSSDSIWIFRRCLNTFGG